jgi:hypothetical protein
LPPKNRQYPPRRNVATGSTRVAAHQLLPRWVTSVDRARRNDTGTVLPLLPHLRTSLGVATRFTLRAKNGPERGHAARSVYRTNLLDDVVGASQLGGREDIVRAVAKGDSLTGRFTRPAGCGCACRPPSGRTAIQRSLVCDAPWGWGSFPYFLRASFRLSPGVNSEAPFAAVPASFF